MVDQLVAEQHDLDGFVVPKITYYFNEFDSGASAIGLVSNFFFVQISSGHKTDRVVKLEVGYFDSGAKVSISIVFVKEFGKIILVADAAYKQKATRNWMAF
jgi:hypothetical protein